MSRNNSTNLITNLLLAISLVVSSNSWGADETPERETAKTAPAEAPAPVPEKVSKWNADQTKIISFLDDLFAASKLVNSGGDPQKKSREKIESAMNWDRIAVDCLGAKQWAAQSAKNRQQFKDLLHEVVAKTAFSRLNTFWKDAAYQFEKIEITGKEAHAMARFVIGEDNITLDYYLERAGSSWKVHDIGYEGFRYSTNINEQLTDFLRDEGFTSLLDRLKKRLDSLNKGKKA